MPPVERGWITFVVDRVFGWWSGLPRETSSYTTEFIQIPIGDVKLAANLYQPTTSPRGTILIRTSYGIAPLMALGNAQARILLTVRTSYLQFMKQKMVLRLLLGCVNSLGIRDLLLLTGGSYLGHTQWAILTDPPPDMKAAIISTGPVDFGAFTWGTGAMETHMIAWATLMTAPKRGITPGLPYIRKLPQTLQPVYDSLPLMDGIKDHLQNKEPPWLEELISQSDTSTPFWSRADQSVALQKVKIPILQSTGWNDSVLPMILNQHSVLVEQGAPAFLTIGPWSHLGSQRGPTLIEGLQFFDYYLAGRGTAPRASPCRVFVTGLNEWRDLTSWPPPASSTRDFFLSPNTLSKEQPEQASSSSFTFNPNDATPPIGMPRPFDDVQPTNYNDNQLAQRSDVAVFDTPPLESDVEVCGKPLIELHHSTDNPHADILVRLSEVDSRGKSTRISDVYKRLDPARGPEPLSLALVDCAHVFRKGMKIRVIIAGGAHPAYLRNLGTGENQAYGATTKPAVHTIHHSKDAVSRLTLPVKARN
ncbi:Xaa-Pro dipeptidyl-peptidase, C-terminal [Fusarium oxysporum f. sp. vasinfectum]|nr:Xaa-Pro dipeptidyl-peptidase, C-terminal [Fusarium oxysporum f. sp. vasinfectum]